MLQYYTEIERLRTHRIVMSWDVALSEQETGDYSVGVVLLNRSDSYYVLVRSQERSRAASIFLTLAQ